MIPACHHQPLTAPFCLDNTEAHQLNQSAFAFQRRHRKLAGLNENPTPEK
jgi:hypothetical protein